MESIADLVEKSYTGTRANAYRDFVPTEAQKRELLDIGRDVLAHVPFVPGACAVMSALFLARWETSNAAPAYVVAGELFVDSTRVFGDDKYKKDLKPVFQKSQLSWDGHCWLQFGDCVADSSVFRTAKAKGCPPALAKFVAENFGANTGLLIGKTDKLAEKGLRYEPLYVLTKAEVDGLLLGAEVLFRPR
jgi:hypothetical protein